MASGQAPPKSPKAPTMPRPSARLPDWPGFDPAESDRLGGLVEVLSREDGPADSEGVWPDRLWNALVGAKATRWALPGRFPDAGGDRPSLVRRYARVAEGSLTAAFILTQHDAAVRRLVAASGPGRRRADQWIERIAEGSAFATVGISQLTTSRKHGPRAMAASPTDSGHRLDGAMPWVTAAERADLLVTGGVLDDGSQMLIALPSDRPGVTIHPPMPLAALGASVTSEVICEAAEVQPEDVLAGPALDVMATPGLAGTGGLETSALAMGQARAALKALAEQAEARGDLIEPFEALAASWSRIAEGLIAAAEGRPDAPPPPSIRAEANALVLRATQAFLTARKGSGFVRDEPAQRWARQALFFLVWSCPSPVANAAIRDLAGICP